MQENHGKYGASFGTHSYTNYHHSMSDSAGLIEYPVSRAHPRFVRARVSGIERGQDPKENWINYCKPQCHTTEKALQRCEAGLKIVSSKDPEKTCIYRYRQWVECVENCVQPKVFYHLKGASKRGPLDWFDGHGYDGLH